MTASVATSMKKKAALEAAVSAASLAMRALRTANVISSIRNASKPAAPGLLILEGLGKWQGGEGRLSIKSHDHSHRVPRQGDQFALCTLGQLVLAFSVYL